MREFDKPEKESYLLGKLDQCSVKSKKRCKHNERERQKFKYSFLDIGICEETFIFIHDIGNKAFKNLKHHYKANGVESRIHGHTGRRAPNAVNFNDIENTVKFIKKYGEDNGLPMPQRLEVEMISLQFSFLHMKQKFIYILSIESLVLLVISDPLVLLCLKIYGLILCRM